MSARVIFAEEAVKDVDEAYRWYERRRDGLGDEFLASVDGAIQKTAENPEWCEIVFDGFRRATIRRFPYVVFYEFANGVITVYAVFHVARDPEKWRDRLA